MKHVAAMVVAILAMAMAVQAEEAPGKAAGAHATRNVAVLLYDGVELLDFAGPAEVFTAAAGQATSVSGGPAAFRVYTVARTAQPILAQGFLRVRPDFSIADAPVPDLLVVPGGNSGALQRDPEMMKWLEGAARGSEITLTVCTGVFPLAKLGLLDGKEITTWYGALDTLRAQARRSTVQTGRRFVDNGQFVTTAGVSAGIDGALHVVARLLGRHLAGRTAQYMEYHWSPEAYLLTRYPLFNPAAGEAGRVLQRAAIAEEEGDTAGAAAAYREAATRDGSRQAWMKLARLDAGAKAFDEAEAAFVQAGQDPQLRAVALYNAACAAAQAGRREDAVRHLQASMAAGFETPSYILDDDDLASVHADPRVRALAQAPPVKVAGATKN